MADGPAYGEAVENVESVMRQWIETALELGRALPERKAGQTSGGGERHDDEAPPRLEVVEGVVRHDDDGAAPALLTARLPPPGCPLELRNHRHRRAGEPVEPEAHGLGS